MSREGNQIAPHLSPGQINAYLNEELSNQKRHSLEKHLLDCELCSDAVEGISSMGVSLQAGMDQLKARLKERVNVESAPVFTIWRVAAAIVVLAAATFLVYNYTGQTEEVISEKSELTGNEEEQTLASTQDSLMEESITQQNLIAQKETKEESADREIDPVVVLEPVKDNLIAAAKAEPEEIEETEIDSDITDLGGGEKVASEPLIAETVDSANANRTFTSLAKAKKVEAEVVISNRTNTRQSIILREETQQNVRIAYMDLTGIESVAEPVNGLENLEGHVISNMNYPEEARNNGVSGYVVLLFKVNDSGELEDIKVDQSLGNGCDEEALRLIKTGPEWTPAKGSEGNISSSVKVWLKFPVSIPSKN